LSTKNIRRKKSKRIPRKSFFIYGFRSGRWIAIDFLLAKNIPVNELSHYKDDFEYLTISDSRGKILYKTVGFYLPPIKKKPVKKKPVKKKIVEKIQEEIEEEIPEKIPERKPPTIKPVKDVINQFTVEDVEDYSDNEIAAMIWDEMEAGATIFRFWYQVPLSPEYPQGAGSTGFRDLPRLNITSLKRLQQYIRFNIPGKILQWFYFVGKL